MGMVLLVSLNKAVNATDRMLRLLQASLRKIGYPDAENNKFKPHRFFILYITLVSLIHN